MTPVFLLLLEGRKPGRKLQQWEAYLRGKQICRAIRRPRKGRERDFNRKPCHTELKLGRVRSEKEAASTPEVLRMFTIKTFI